MEPFLIGSVFAMLQVRKESRIFLYFGSFIFPLLEGTKKTVLKILVLKCTQLTNERNVEQFCKSLLVEQVSLMSLL